ncbi:hypothetical protein DB346_02530 [Verrucomicrobia bacterium LW23]|nr:hypothetical protein DB346_04125 [Verrucomicrobia bacterium LW23]PTY04325.1 hypothetical protein DB346_02530 [Verrucomicrobia bacterium LW23]
MSSSSPLYRIAWLHRYLLFLAGSIFVLITSGGVVTSHAAGMAVPDWPNSFGYNMFLLPISKWFESLDIIQEHTHRLIASFVGFVTIGLVIYVGLVVYKFKTDRRGWLMTLSVIALVAVIIQGVLGGLRVHLVDTRFGIFHGCLAQAFFSLICLMALFTSHWWVVTSRNIAARAASAGGAAAPALSSSAAAPLVPLWVSRSLLAITVCIFVQLTLGATMRHAHVGKEHLGLAVPDFPLAYGKVWPDTSDAALAIINERRDNSTDAVVFPITREQIWVHMSHRLMAVLITLAAAAYCVAALRARRMPAVLRRSALIWSTLVFVQFCLGAATIWSGKAADIATLHVACGTLLLMFGTVQIAIALRLQHLCRQPAAAAAPEKGAAPTGLAHHHHGTPRAA